MGAQSFETRSRGDSAAEAYRNAVSEAEHEYGHQQGYSGAINATPGFRDATSKFKSSGKNMNQFISERLERLTKFDGAECICIREPKGNTNKIKSQVEHIVTPGTKKWVLKYVVRTQEDVLSKHNTKGEAVKAARAYTEKNQESTNVVMEKVLETGKAIVATVSYKRASDEREGEYVFYGWASC